MVKLRISDETGIIKMNEFWDTFYLIQAKLRMYGSSRIIKQATEFEEHLYACWECGNNDIGGTEEMREKLIKSIRKEANID